MLNNRALWSIWTNFFYFFFSLWSLKSIGLQWIHVSLNSPIFQLSEMSLSQSYPWKVLWVTGQALVFCLFETLSWWEGHPRWGCPKAWEGELGWANFSICSFKQWHDFSVPKIYLYTIRERAEKETTVNMVSAEIESIPVHGLFVLFIPLLTCRTLALWGQNRAF